MQAIIVFMQTIISFIEKQIWHTNTKNHKRATNIFQQKAVW